MRSNSLVQLWVLCTSHWTCMYAHHASADTCAYTTTNQYSYTSSHASSFRYSHACSHACANACSHSISYATPL